MNRTVIWTVAMLVAVVGFAMMGEDQEAAAGLFGRKCCKPACCEPAPSCSDSSACDCGGRMGLFARLRARRCNKAACCAPEPSCCAPAPSCGCESACEPSCGCGSAAPSCGCDAGCGCGASAAPCGCEGVTVGPTGGEGIAPQAPAPSGGIPLQQAAPEAPAVPDAPAT